jgi:dTDP-4-amino-4,6-dideoxygalactose transaminase
MVSKPKLLGGIPIFEEKVNIVRPVLPGLNDVEESLRKILQSGMVTKGQYLQAFQEEVATHLGVKHAIAVSSCTTGLILAFKGLGLTGEVIVPSFTFMATVSAIIWAGLKPVFIDVDVGTTNINPALIEEAITPKTTAVVAVHNFGNPASVAALRDLADRHNLELIFDAAHGFGACYRGEPVGGFGKAEVFSLSPTKLVIAGEGGIVSTNDDELAEKVQIGREYGMRNYDSVFPGINARMPEFNAVMGLHSLRLVEGAAQQRNVYVSIYHELLGKLPGIGFQEVHSEDRCSFKDFSIVIDENRYGLSRDELATALTSENIDVRKYYDPPVHRQMAYKEYCPSDRKLPATELLASCSLSLPIWSCMDKEICEGICSAIVRIHHHAEGIRKLLRVV